MATDRINSAYSRCKSQGTLFTVEKLTGLPVNYLITRQLPRLQADRRQARRRVDGHRPPLLQPEHRSSGNYATINLQPGYQQLSGGQALDFVRFRHTDSDLYRVARQQEFVRSFREQVQANFSPLKVPSLVHTIAGNIEIAEGGHPSA